MYLFLDFSLDAAQNSSSWGILNRESITNQGVFISGSILYAWTDV